MSMNGQFRHIPPGRLQDLEGDAAAIADLLLAEEDEASSALDIEKAWHVVHYLLTGSAWEGQGPAASAVLGGRDVCEDLGYGPARWLDAAGVSQVATVLDDLDLKQMSNQYDAAKLIAAEIYPFAGASLDDVDPGAREWALDAFKSLRAYYREAANAGHGMLLALL